jgi:DsbC/DsbD-like thiol-disulfide interchange protein
LDQCTTTFYEKNATDNSWYFIESACLAQKDPVHFAYRAEKTGEKTYAIHVTANIEDGWHIYSQTQPKQHISQPTKIVFKNNPLFVFTGIVAESGDKKKYEDKIADIIQYQYDGKVEFVQTVTMRSTAKTTLTGAITYQACTEEMCQQPQTVPFSISIE